MAEAAPVMAAADRPVSDPVTEAQPWLSLSEAAAMTGLNREALRARARRGQVSSRKNNRGELLVQVPAGAVAEADRGVAGAMADLLAEVADLRERLARAEAVADTAKATAEAGVVAAREVAEARVSAARAEAKAVRELADRLTNELSEARRPWWRRWWR